MFNNPRDSWRHNVQETLWLNFKNYITEDSITHCICHPVKQERQSKRQLKKCSVILLIVHLLMKEDNQQNYKNKCHEVNMLWSV